MVPIEVRAFGLLAVCVLILAGVLLFQVTPRYVLPWPLSVLACLLVAVLAVVVWVLTRYP